MKHRFKHLIDNNEVLVSETPTTKIDLTEQAFETVEDDPQKSFGDDDFDNYDDDDDGEGDDDDDYQNDKVTVAEDEKSILSEARVVFQRDPKTGKTFMICQVEEWDVPDDIADSSTMFTADIIYRPFREYSGPKKELGNINPKFFKKKNWKEKP